jgi:hypothetical protein
MKRKDYQRPTMKVVELRHRTTLLQQSANAGLNVQRSSYGEANIYTWDDEQESE